MKVGLGGHPGTHKKSVSPFTGTPRHTTTLPSLCIMCFICGHSTTLVVKNKNKPEPPDPTTQLSNAREKGGYFWCSH